VQYHKSFIRYIIKLINTIHYTSELLQLLVNEEPTNLGIFCDFLPRNLWTYEISMNAVKIYPINLCLIPDNLITTELCIAAARQIKLCTAAQAKYFHDSLSPKNFVTLLMNTYLYFRIDSSGGLINLNNCSDYIERSNLGQMLIKLTHNRISKTQLCKLLWNPWDISTYITKYTKNTAQIRDLFYHILDILPSTEYKIIFINKFPSRYMTDEMCVRVLESINTKLKRSLFNLSYGSENLQFYSYIAEHFGLTEALNNLDKFNPENQQLPESMFERVKEMAIEKFNSKYSN
jgi:hypothetical protein